MQLGKAIFEGKGKCINCHGGAETTNASVNNVVNAQELLERMVMGDGGIAVYDNGFYNTGVRPNATINRNGEDQGLGATIGPLNLPLSNSRLFQRCVQNRIGQGRSEEHTSELQSLRHLVCRLLLEKKKQNSNNTNTRQ